MGKWSDNDYYPCTVLKQQNSGYLVEFYDGLTKQIRAIQTKKMSKEDEQKALKIAEDKFSPSNNLPKGRKSVYKREKPTTPTQNDTTPEPIEEPKPKRIKLDVENKKRRHNGRFAKAVPEPFELENAKGGYILIDNNLNAWVAFLKRNHRSGNQTVKDVRKLVFASDSQENFNRKFLFSIPDLDRLTGNQRKPLISLFWS